MSREPNLPRGFDENPEWTEEDFRTALRPHEFPPEIFEAFPNTPRPGKTTVQVSSEVVERFKQGGSDWEARIDQALRKAAGLA